MATAYPKLLASFANTDLSAVDDFALRYKQLWTMVASFLEPPRACSHTRPIFHKSDATAAGNGFCSFLALVLRDEPSFDRLDNAGVSAEWDDRFCAT